MSACGSSQDAGLLTIDIAEIYDNWVYNEV